jgi:ribosomal protein L13E
MWTRRDWDEFFRISQTPWQRLRPPRPISNSTQNRPLPVAGFSLTELQAAGLSLEQAEAFALPVDAGRLDSYEPNVSALRDFARLARDRR